MRWTPRNRLPYKGVFASRSAWNFGGAGRSNGKIPPKASFVRGLKMAFTAGCRRNLGKNDATKVRYPPQASFLRW